MRTKLVIREAWQGLGRNLTMTIALVITAAISLALLATGMLVTGMTERTKEIYLDRVEVMVQFNEEISASDQDCSSEGCKQVRDALQNDDEVETVIFRNRQESYARFVELFQDSDPKLVAATSKDALPAALHVRLKDPLNTKPLEKIKDLPAVAEIVDQTDDLRNATGNLDSVRNATFLVAAIQAVAAIFLIANMVQIAAFSRREEISIMRMVGASRWFTQAPFVLEALVAALFGSVFAVAGLFAAKAIVLDKALSPLYDAHLIARLTNGDIWVISPIIALVGMGFAALTAAITLRLYVRK